MKEKLMDLATVVKKSRIIAETYGVRYQKEVMGIDKWTPDLLSNDWFASLEFWFSKAFNRGRRDEISDTFFNRSKSVLMQIGENRLFNVSSEDLSGLLIAAEVNNHIDRKMVVQSIKFINKIPGYNLSSYSIKLIKADKTQQVYSELRSIFGIGPKLASFYLRDLCFAYKFTPKTKEQLICLQPMDTWVRKVSIKLQIPGCTKDKTVDDIVEPVVDFCIKNEISPLLFNSGAWYIGAKSFDLLLEHI